MKQISWWKIILYCLSFIAIYVASTLLSNLGACWIRNDALRIIIHEVAFRVPLTFFLLWAFMRLMIRQPLSFFMFRRPSKAIIKWIVIGILLPALVILIYLVFQKISLIAIGSTRVLYYILETVILACSTGFLEEVLFRGYIYKILEEKWNSVVAILAPAFLFGVVHVLEINNVDLVTCLLVVTAGSLVGIMFALVVYKTRNIWNAVVLHTCWNLVLGGKIIMLSSFADKKYEAIFPYQITTDNVLFTGGRFGIESALPAIVVYAGFVFFLLFCRKD